MQTATARHLALVTDTAPIEPQAPATLAPRLLTFPDGVRVPARARGVYRCDVLAGASFVLYAVDSTGDWRHMQELVPVTATAEEFRAAELRLWALLDACDPVCHATAGRAMLGPADPL